MPLTGGLRDRMILESVFQAIKADLTTLGWFGTNRQHLPITMIDAFPDEKDTVALNTVAISYENTYSELLEMGSKASIQYMELYADFFAESDGLGRHFIGDIKQFFESNTRIPVYDYDKAVPVIEFYLEVVEESIDVRHPSRATNPWQKHWYVCSAMVRDDRTNA